ncbi:hypothetical protein [Neobacillus rhizosphaerae]|uniref:hypothetical protein n=1 Tax=Neobacillus rhizosphaerae TaxID=2880965 RepID=UPI0020101BDB|nr:hypothetical protein [Neobacillus rhizosphaerae]
MKLNVKEVATTAIKHVVGKLTSAAMDEMKQQTDFNRRQLTGVAFFYFLKRA